MNNVRHCAFLYTRSAFVHASQLSRRSVLHDANGSRRGDDVARMTMHIDG